MGFIQENLLKIKGGPPRVTSHPSSPKTVLVLAPKVLDAEKSLSLKQAEIVDHDSPKTLYQLKSL